MSDLIFNPERGNLGGDKYYGQGPQKSKLAEFIIKLSGGKLDEQKANLVMAGLLIVIVIATITIIYSTFAGNSPKNNSRPPSINNNALPPME